MQKAVLMLCAFIGVWLLNGPARAVEYPWCLYYGGSGLGGGTNCGFTTFEQCLATLRGNGGICSQNPFYAAPGPQRRRH
jgi:Protein of unknown function (DUF3551)